MQKQTLTLVFPFIALASLTLALGCSSDDEAPKNPGAGGSSGASGTGGSSGGGGGLTCAEMCGKIVPLGCSKGPPSESLCGAFCSGLVAGTDSCAASMNALLACMQPSTMAQCASDGNVTSADCANEFAAVVPCLPST